MKKKKHTGLILGSAIDAVTCLNGRKAVSFWLNWYYDNFNTFICEEKR